MLVRVVGWNVWARVFDRPLNPGTSATPSGLAYAIAHGATASWKVQAAAWLAALGVAPHLVEDTPGLVVARAVAMLVNEAADAVQPGDHYPAGPFEWLAAWDAPGVIAVIEALDATYRGERYRVSPWLRRHA